MSFINNEAGDHLSQSEAKNKENFKIPPKRRNKLNIKKKKTQIPGLKLTEKYEMYDSVFGLVLKNNKITYKLDIFKNLDLFLSEKCLEVSI